MNNDTLDTNLLDELDQALGDGETAPEVTATATPTPASASEPEPGTPTEPESAAPLDTSAAALPAATPVPGADPNTPQPFAPPDGEPFAFRVDGSTVSVPNARVVGDWVMIPREGWHREVVPRLGDRSEWHRREQGYQREIAAAREGNQQETLRARAMVARVNELLSNPEKFEAFAANWQQNAPLLIQQAENDALRRQVEAVDQRKQQEIEQEAVAKVEPLIQGDLESQFETYLKDRGHTHLLPGPDGQWPKGITELYAELWGLYKQGGLRLYEGDPRQGYALNEALFRRVMDREVGRLAAQQAHAATVTQATATNAAALAPTPAGRTVAPTPAKAGPVSTARKPSASQPKKAEPFDKDQWLRGQKFLDDDDD